MQVSYFRKKKPYRSSFLMHTAENASTFLPSFSYFNLGAIKNNMIFPSKLLLRPVYCSSGNFPIITEKGIKEKLSKETGWDRIKRMYTTDEFGISPEMNYVISAVKWSLVLGVAFGGVGSVIQVQKEFILKNKAASFDSEYLAKRNLTNVMTIAFAKGGISSSLRYGAFAGIYLLSTMTVANYRDKISVWEHAASGAVLGGLSKMNYGVKGFAVAGVLGGVLGLVAGGVITMTTGYGGMTMDELRCWLHEEHYQRLGAGKRKEENKAS